MVHKRKMTPLKWIAIGVSILVFIFGLAFGLGVALSRLVVLESFLTLLPHERLVGVNILAYGIDETQYVKRSDSILVFHLSGDGEHIGVMSIPRDTRVNVPGLGLTKINHAYAEGGSVLLKQTVSQFLQVPIDHTVQFNLQGVADIVDAMGGVEITVKKDLYYEDKAADLSIEIEKGRQTLDGEQSVQYLRFRQDKEGDMGRIRRQQQFVQQVAKKFVGAGRVLELPGLIHRVSKMIKTDLSLKEMIGLAIQFGEAFENGMISKGSVPGAIMLVDGVSYWKPNVTQTDTMVSSVLMGFDQAKMPKSQVMQVKTVDKSASEEARRKVTMKEVSRVAEQQGLEEISGIVVEILNGFGVPGEARKAASLVKQLGYKVPKFDNAGSFTYDHTLLVDWKGNVDAVLALANRLQIDPSRIIVYDRPAKPLDVTLVLGDDWPVLYEKLKKE